MIVSLRIHWWAAAFILPWGPVQAADATDYRIADIWINGNEKTRQEILLRELGFRNAALPRFAELGGTPSKGCVCAYQHTAADSNVRCATYSGVVFLDTGAVADSMSSAKLSRSAIGADVALGWKLKRFVKTDAWGGWPTGLAQRAADEYTPPHRYCFRCIPALGH